MPIPSGTITSEQVKDPSSIYNQMGLIATGSPLSYVGKVAYFATRTPDSTAILTSISIPNRMLSFVRDGDTYRAPYEVHLRLLQGTAEVKSLDVMEIVRVATFKEVNRTDESVIFQNYFTVKPGEYTVSFMVRDVASNRSATQEGAITVPKLLSGHLSTPLLVYEAVDGPHSIHFLTCWRAPVPAQCSARTVRFSFTSKRTVSNPDCQCRSWFRTTMEQSPGVIQLFWNAVATCSAVLFVFQFRGSGSA
jgi:hypothetical protein